VYQFGVKFNNDWKMGSQAMVYQQYWHKTVANGCCSNFTKQTRKLLQ